MNNVGAKLRAYRKRKGLTQQQIADLMGITVRAYQNYEAGTRSPSLAKAFELASILDIKVDELSVRNCSTESA